MQMLTTLLLIGNIWINPVDVVAIMETHTLSGMPMCSIMLRHQQSTVKSDLICSEVAKLINDEIKRISFLGFIEE
jgi:hypothetical protein